MIRKKATRNNQGNEDTNPGLDISSLIDVSFLLLIYFLITSTLDPKEGDIRMTMPGIPQGTTTPVTIDPPQIIVDSVGVVSLEEEVLDSDPESRRLVHLEDRLKTYLEAYRVIPSNGDPSVSLKVDDAVPGQRFIDVMNCLAGVGITDVRLIDFERE